MEVEVALGTAMRLLFSGLQAVENMNRVRFDGRGKRRTSYAGAHFLGRPIGSVAMHANRPRRPLLSFSMRYLQCPSFFAKGALQDTLQLASGQAEANQSPQKHVPRNSRSAIDVGQHKIKMKKSWSMLSKGYGIPLGT